MSQGLLQWGPMCISCNISCFQNVCSQTLFPIFVEQMPNIPVLHILFMWIHMFCLLSRDFNEFDTSRTGSELVLFHWYVSSREKLVDTPNFFTESGKFTYGNTWIELVELVSSLTEHVKSRVLVCWVYLTLYRRVLMFTWSLVTHITMRLYDVFTLGGRHYSSGRGSATDPPDSNGFASAHEL